MSLPHSFDPIILGVTPKIPYPYADPRRGIYTTKVIDTIITLLDGKGSTEDRLRRIQKSQKLSAIISSLVEGHLMDLSWQGAINPSNYTELDALCKCIKAMILTIDKLPKALKTALNYDPLPSKSKDVREDLIISVKDSIKCLEERAEALSQGSSGRGRPEKQQLKRTCDNARRLWETIEKKKFPMSFRIHKSSAVDPSFHFVYTLVCIFLPETQISEVSYQLKKSGLEGKKRKR